MYYGGVLLADPNDNGTFWQGGKTEGNLDNGVAKTTDGGTTWELDTLAIRQDSHYLSTMAIAIALSNSDIVFAGGYDAVYTGSSTDTMVALYKTTDGGDTWAACTTGGISGAVHGLAIKPDDASIVYAGTSDGVFKSTDQGTTWTNTGLSRVRDLIIDPRAPNWIYAGTDSGVYVSFSGGNEWEVMNDGLAYRKTRCLEMVADDYLYAGTWGNSIYRCVPAFDDIWPPQAPNIVDVRKSGNHAVLYWHTVVTDTLHNPDSVDYYTIYRNTSPSFIPSSADSIGVVYAPDTTFTDANALVGAQDYYYLITATDKRNRTGPHSSMAYVFHKTMNENPTTTDKNWTSLPWHNDYTTVSDLTDDLSPLGDPLTKITNLRDDQQFESWLWDSDFFEWYGDNFAIASGRGYECVTTSDTVVILVGANDPHGFVTLNENADKTDKNWVSIPYNAVYTSVSAITSEYSPGGVPLTKLTNLRDDQQFESWLWDSDFFEWYGENFAIVPGRSYEFVTTVDTTWDPTEYSGSKQVFLASRGSGIDVHLGAAASSDRTPLWHMADGVWHIANSILPMAGEPRAQGTGLGAQDKERHTPHAVSSVARQASSVEREASGVERGAVSHIVLVHIAAEQCGDIVFTAYRPDQPYDVLTEAMVGSGRALKDGRAALWFDVGNFATPWQPGEEVILIIESYINGTASVAITAFSLDALVDMQKLDNVTLQPIPEPTVSNKNAHWTGITNDNVVGYSLYDADTRLNTTIISDNVYETNHDAFLRPVIRGGFETVYSSQGKHNSRTSPTATTYALSISPNPFSNKTIISYGMSDERHKELPIHIYDISGRLVKSFGPLPCAPGTMQLSWDGTDAHGRTVPSGVYFVRLVTDEKTMQEKVLLIR